MKNEKHILKRIISIVMIVVIVVTSMNIQKREVVAKSNRDIVYDYMYNMATVKWTAAGSFTTNNGPADGFVKGIKYTGIPYSWNGSVVSLEK